MKISKTILVFIVSFVTFYMLLSLVGCMFYGSDGNHLNYFKIIGEPAWAMIYSMFGGWWMAAMISNEYYDLLEDRENRKNW